MLYILTGIIYLFNLRYGRTKYFLYIMFVFLFLMLAGSYGTYDTMIFYQRYENYESFVSFTEPLFTLIVAFFNAIGFSSQQFMMIISFFELIALFWFLKKYCNNIGAFFSLFMIFPMLMMFTQLRFLMGFTVVLCGCFPAIFSKGRLYILRYVFFALVAFTLHSACIIYLVFLPLVFFDFRKTVIYTCIITMLLSSEKYIVMLINFALSFYNEEKVSIVLRATTGTEGQLGRCLLTLAMSIGMLLVLLLIKKKYIGNIVNVQDTDMLDLVMKMDILSVIFVPLILSFSSGFYRIPQSLLILNYVVVANHLYIEKSKTKLKSFILILTTMLFAVVLSFMIFKSKEMYGLVIQPYFEENLFL